MFTGIIEETGVIKTFSSNGNSALVVVECDKVLEGIKIGDSIAINGVCQTVTEFGEKTFSAQASAETLSVTTFSKFKTGDNVNLERALTLSSRLGGHIVLGHVDGTGQIKNIKNNNDFYTLKIHVENELAKYIAKKGSVTVNGISLTIANIENNDFEIAIIPHTFKNTNLQDTKIGDFVNIEVDILARYIEKFLSTGNNSCKNRLDENFLKENGFL